ncbi:alpha/beta hydrolase [Streptomyces anulatus]|uniref:alpha/beta hydrolase n=1 Tax=Streptomyces anulatus TaxID=1892 RepID=UPI003664D02B
MFVHGVGKPREAKTELEEWRAALIVGARAAGHSRKAAELLDGGAVDTHFAYYGDLFLPGAALDNEAVAPAPVGPDEDEGLRELLLDMVDDHIETPRDDRQAQALRVTRNKLAPTGEEQGPGSLARQVLVGANALFAVPYLRTFGGWISAGAMKRDLHQVRRYLARKETDKAGLSLDQRIRARVARELDLEGPTVVVAHSLGTVVAFETLHAHTAHVPLFVTLGSPLGMRTAVRPRVRPQPVRTPEPVGRWLNFWDRDDFVTGGTELALCIASNGASVAPVSTRVDSDGLNVHPAVRYLAQPAVAGPLIEALDAATGA